MDYDWLTEAARTIGQVAARIPHLAELESQIVANGEAAARAARAGDEATARVLGHTVDVGLRAYATALGEHDEVRRLAGDPDTLLGWVIRLFRALSPALAADLAEPAWQPPRGGRQH